MRRAAVHVPRWGHGLSVLSSLHPFHPPGLSRGFSSLPTMEVFDRRIKLAQRDRLTLQPDSIKYEYLRDEVARRLIDRLSDITRKFPVAADVGCNRFNIARQLPPGQSGIETLISLDTSIPSLLANRHLLPSSSSSSSSPTYHHVAAFDESHLPLSPSCFDLLLSSLSLHWYNDLPSLFSQCLSALKPDSPFLLAILGGSTLQELRSSFSLSDRERLGTLLPHVSPFTSGRDLGDLLQAAGFALPTIDADTITVRYPDMWTLMEHLQGMGEQGAGAARVGGKGGKEGLVAAASVYEEMYRDEEGMVPATFQVFYAIGWKPHESQPQPKKRGSATKRFAELEKMIAEKDREKEEQEKKKREGAEKTKEDIK